MKSLLLCFGVAALGNVIYHIGQKTQSPSINPMVLLMAVYAVAFLLSASALPFFKGSVELGSFTQLFQWPIWVLGIGIWMIELGFLLAYRAGGSMQWSGVLVNAASALLLVPLAVGLFRESFSLARALGIVLTLSGLALLAKR